MRAIGFSGWEAAFGVGLRVVCGLVVGLGFGFVRVVAC